MTDKPKRRWFRFSFRTLLIVVTLFCVWLGWQVCIVQERNALLHRLEAANIHILRDRPLNLRPVQISIVRRLLGDECIFVIELTNTFEKERKRIAAAFPEAATVLCPSFELSTTTLIEFLTETPQNAPVEWCAIIRAKAIDVLGERKANEAIPHLIECLADGRALDGSDNWVGGHAANALASTTGREFSVDQAEWRKWWKEQQKP